MLLARELTERVIGLAIEVHRLTGPGMLESVYEGCLCYELGQAGIAFERQTGIPVAYKGVQFDEGFRADILVDRQLILEIKAVASILPAHEAQLLTYLRMSGLRLGLLFNFHARLLKGIRPASAALPRGSGV
jgi:GxxExxY protein